MYNLSFKWGFSSFLVLTCGDVLFSRKSVSFCVACKNWFVPEEEDGQVPSDAGIEAQ